MIGAELSALDETLSQATVTPSGPIEDSPFRDERKGWKGYIEWEKYPEKKAAAAAILAKHTFPPPPEFQMGPIPDTNPVLEGVRWKLWHKAIGGDLWSVPEESWLRVVQEKHKDMLHLLQFPYNGEPPKVGSMYSCF